MSDQLASGRRFRILNIVDDYSQQCVGQIVDTSITGARLACYLDELGKRSPLPKTMVCDNGSELTSYAMFFFGQKTGVELAFIQPGKPTQNALIERFNSCFRDNCLNEHWFRDLQDVRQIIDRWRHHYNDERPHSSLGYVTLAEHANRAAQMMHSPSAQLGRSRGKVTRHHLYRVFTVGTGLSDLSRHSASRDRGEGHPAWHATISGTARLKRFTEQRDVRVGAGLEASIDKVRPSLVHVAMVIRTGEV